MLLACAPCGSISRISKFFSGFQKSKISDLEKEKNGGTTKKGKTEEETYQEKLEKLLGNPSFVFVSSNQKDKGATAIVKSENDTKIGSIPLEVKGAMIAINPEGTRAYVTSYNSNKILILDIENNKLVKTIESKDEPFGIASNPNGKRVYITHHKSNYISILDTDKNEIVGTIQVKDHPACVTVSFDGNKAYIGHTEYSK
jgi:YVTN family beta-propeller protein